MGSFSLTQGTKIDEQVVSVAFGEGLYLFGYGPERGHDESHCIRVTKNVGLSFVFCILISASLAVRYACGLFFHNVHHGSIRCGQRRLPRSCLI